MNITRFSIKRPIGISMIFALIVVLGIFSFFRIGVELLPEVDSPYISVIVSYPGASTESVEQQVTKPIEDVLSSISHFKQVRSATRPGRAEIFAACLPIAFVGLISGISQGKAAAAGVMLVGKRPSELAKGMLFAAMVETYAVLALLVSFLMLNSIQL